MKTSYMGKFTSCGISQLYLLHLKTTKRLIWWQSLSQSASRSTAASRITTDVPSSASWVTLCFTSRSISGHTIPFSFCLAASLLNTLAASALWLMWPSSPVISEPKASTYILWHVVPGRYASWPSLSQSTTVAPSLVSRWATLTCHWQSLQWDQWHRGGQGWQVCVWALAGWCQEASSFLRRNLSWFPPQ